MDSAVKPEIEDPEKKKKKEEKAREKELKRQKFLEKTAKLKAQKPSDAPKKSEKKNVRRTKEENSEDFVDPETPFGEKKCMSHQMAKQYNPKAVEKSWYAWWEKSGFFKADTSSSKPSFVIVLPPPNVTGALHIGHALTAAIEVVVEKKLMRERKLTRHDIGRERFVSEVWDWNNKYGGMILQQLRSLSASLDWSREDRR